MDGVTLNAVAGVAPRETAILSTIRSIGFHPFVLVSVQEGLESEQSFIVCKTQNEIGEFAAEVVTKPWSGESRLLRGLTLALSRNTDEAVGLLCAWLQGAGAACEETVVVLQPDAALVHAQYNYPVFSYKLNAASADTQQRGSMLTDAFWAYLRADGNNASRYLIVEAVALALSRYLSARDRPADALEIVKAAIGVNPDSSALEALRSGLERGAHPKPHDNTTTLSSCDGEPATENSFIYIAAMMKAGSTLMWLIASALQEPNGRAAPEKMDGVPPNEFLPLHQDTLNYFPRGGVYKNHAPISYHTDRFQKETGSKCIILLRHPADHVAGFYCHQRGIISTIREMDSSIPGNRLTPWWLAAGPTQVDKFNPKVPVHEGIGHLISDGYLFKILEWIAEWVRFRNPSLSIILTYEQLMNDYDGALVQLSQFIRGEPPNTDVLNYLRHVNNSVADEGREKGKLDKYPYGWTGRIGTWTQYFSFENACRYNEVVGKFLACHPFASGLLDVYPSPFIDAGAIERTATPPV